MANNDTGTHTTKLKPTLDDIQKRFSCGRDELCIWRNSLCYRYSAITNNEFSVEISDYDINDSVLGGIPLFVPLPPPSELSKTVIRIYCEKVKSITVTLYFTAQATGTLLCQRIMCAKLAFCLFVLVSLYIPTVYLRQKYIIAITWIKN